MRHLRGRKIREFVADGVLAVLRWHIFQCDWRKLFNHMHQVRRWLVFFVVSSKQLWHLRTLLCRYHCDTIRGEQQWGMHEFCWMTISFFGFVWLIGWRGRAVSGAAH